MTVGRRVMVTGVGLVSPVAIGTQANWDALLAGKSGIRTITRFDASQHSARIAGEVEGFDPLTFLEKKDVKKMDVFIQYAIAAAQFAVDDAHLKVTPEIADNVGVFIASGIGGFTTIEREHIELMKGGPRRISPFFIPASIINLAAGQVSIRFGARGPNLATCTACTASAHAIGEAFEIIRRGDAEIMIAGGSEMAITPLGVGGFAAMRALSTRNDDPEAASRPFDTGRDGFVMGEGAGVVILESLEHAESRGATILAELLGYGATADASHITLPAPGGIGAVRAANRALDKAGLTAADIDHVNAHATSTPEGDKAELQAIKTILGERAGQVSITANKSMLGHTLGAAGAIEAVIAILTIREGCVPPTINLDDPDPEAAGLDLTPNVAARRQVGTVLSNSFGFGGQNTALILGGPPR
jgi:3-oxoacyl-[acyl-carrier-protein] synthase II